VFLAIPVHRFVRPRIERVFFPERPALEDGIHELLDELSEIEDRDRIIEHVCSRLADFLNTRTCIFFGRDHAGYEALYCVGAEAPPKLSTESALVVALRERSVPLASDRLSRRDRIQQLPSAERAILTGLGVTVVVPVRERGDLLGFVCLGAKRSGDIYTSTELALLTAVANVVSVRFRISG
jgi:GAF domain-containing protein